MTTLTASRASHVSKAWVTLATFHDSEDALGFSQFLRRGGIDTQVQDERRLQKWWFMARPRAGIHVRVPGASFEYAQSYVDANPASAGFLHRAVHCPSCNSVRVQFPQMTRKNILPTLVAQCLVLLGVMKREYYCEKCHYTWIPGRR